MSHIALCRRQLIAPLFIAVVLFVVTQPLFSQSEALTQQGWSALARSEVPNVAVRSAAGERIRFPDVLPEDGLTIVNFWATWCAPCVEELPDLQRLSGALEGTGVSIILVNAQEKAKQTQVFLERLGITLTSYYDTRGKLGNMFGTRGLPVSFVIDRQQVIARYVGVFPWTNEEFLDALTGTQ